MDVAKVFKALSDDTRVKIAYVLSLEGELCVCDVANIIESSTATASHHLRLLKNLGIAKYRKEGKVVYYSLDDEHVKQLVEKLSCIKGRLLVLDSSAKTLTEDKQVYRVEGFSCANCAGKFEKM